jgi:hypothetical protein
VSADFRQLHPLSAFLAPWLREGVPDLDALNHIAAARGILTGGGAPLRFVLPADDGEGYEERAWRRGEVATRTDNRHDLFNALIWLAFPRSKAVMNLRHHEALLAARGAGSEARGPLRDALTQFDECGVIVAGAEPELWRRLCAHHWREVFVERRGELLRTTRFVVFGHASHDALGAPFVGLCGKALFIEVDAGWLDLPAPQSLTQLDARLAETMATGDFAPRDWQPLPLLGIPGATAENEHAAYYEDERQFRPPRRMAAGSSPGNR